MGTPLFPDTLNLPPPEILALTKPGKAIIGKEAEVRLTIWEGSRCGSPADLGDLLQVELTAHLHFHLLPSRHQPLTAFKI